ncbi:MAG: pyruvate:ferredoxin (flavodoxin) oxidoreductase [Anaerolineae bacterium]|nr:pyruvate:ferredoxin (flavodoxin) oxidoreductase [Candidatus Roseilinea sp.]MDW8449119.1 pyruvate:ferredoxin (flavodoxin) oxidoreductase [Anaerolineae bacterium]
MTTPASRELVTIDGNEAAAYVAYKTNEVIAIYPITPSSPMSELADQWSSLGERNLWGSIPIVQEMQSEGGAAGTIHGALQAGALATTFTSSQGLLLMIPNMYKIAGELTSTVFHIAARSLATHALSIFGDHSDVMATRSTGWAMLFANSVQEVMDFALIAQASTLAARVPFLHVFDGFRTSHEVMKIERLSESDIRAMIDDDLVQAHRRRALSPDHPFIRGTAHNPDTYFQAREAVNPFYLAVPEIVQRTMDKFAALVGRQYRLFDYVGVPDAERVIVMMGSGCETTEATVNYLAARGEKVGLVKVRLYRPFSAEHFVAALPPTVKAIAVLDRTKEPGAIGEPLYQDVVAALVERWPAAAGQGTGGRGQGTGVRGQGSESRSLIPEPRSLAPESWPLVVGGRYGLSSKEFTPAMAKAIFDELGSHDLYGRAPKNHFTIGIHDDVTFSSLDYDPAFDIEPDDTVRAIFWGLGADGTVGANKNSIKIIGEETDNYAQGYFVYDSKKSGARTISHLRFGPRPIHAPYLISRANFVAVHQFGFLDRYDVLEQAIPGAILLLNSPFPAEETWDHLPRNVQEQILAKRLKVWVIDAYKVAREAGMGNRINTVMQVCFFAVSGVLPREEAIAKIKEAIRKTYGKRGEAVVQRNFAAVDATLEHLYEMPIPEPVRLSEVTPPPVVPPQAPEFVQRVTAMMMAGRGDQLPVSAFPVDGTYPSGTAQWEKRNIALEVPVWDPDICIQCGKCVYVCPHAVIRAKVVEPELLANAPATLKSADARWKELPGKKYVLQVAVEDCTGCALCVEACPVKDKRQTGRKAINMAPQLPIREAEAANWEFFKRLPDYPRTDGIHFNNVKNVQLLQPLFEFSGACAGCGETPYLSLLTRLFGDRLYIANATGCSSIYGGNLPTTPWTYDAHGRGPAWSNSLFEDNAEFGLGMRLALDKQTHAARELVAGLRDVIGPDLADALLNADQSTEQGIIEQRARVDELRRRLEQLSTSSPNLQSQISNLMSLANMLVRKSVWIVGGDGWAYDIGYGGLDHVLASGQNVKLLVLDTEVYSNTGGQASKATPLGAVAKFAAAGKHTRKKDLGMMAMSYGNVYVAQVAMGANDAQTIKAFLEAEAYDGPALIIAYSHCIAHGIDMAKGLHQQKLATDCGYWPLYRYNPALRAEGKNPLQLDSGAPKIPFKDYAYNETRYRMLQQSHPEEAEALMKAAQAVVNEHWQRYEEMALKSAGQPHDGAGAANGGKRSGETSAPRVAA